MAARRLKPSVRKLAPPTPPAETALEALRNIEALLAVRNAGWDRIVVRDIIRVIYGSTEAFARGHLETLRRLSRASA